MTEKQRENAEQQEAVSQLLAAGRLPAQVYRNLTVGERGIVVEGDALGTLISGDHNVIIQRYGGDEGVNEERLLRDALQTYREQLRQEQQKQSQPYRGLLAYRLQDAADFFGREAAIAELFAAVERARITWLHGRSGTGKTSLVQAGLFPKLLAQRALPVYVRPLDEEPTSALKRAVLKRLFSPNLSLAELSMVQFIGALAEEIPEGEEVIVCFDQFEEFFTRLSKEERAAFAQELTACLDDASLPVRFVFSLRSEYFGDTAPIRQRLFQVSTAEYQLKPLTEEESRAAMIRPAEQHGVNFEPGLAEEIQQELAAQEITPQLQLVCSHLYRTLPPGEDTIRTARYDEAGRAEGILRDYLNRVLTSDQEVPPAERATARRILSSLVTPEGTREQRSVRDWYRDGALEEDALRWYLARHEHLKAARPFTPDTVRRLAREDYLERVGDRNQQAWRDLAQEMTEDIVSAFRDGVRCAYVDRVLYTLSLNRLVRVVKLEGEEPVYELAHDYLTAEVQSWEDEAAQQAKDVRYLLAQKHRDFQQHRLVLDEEEMAIVESALGNAHLHLSPADQRLLLLSAVATPRWEPWLEQAGADGRGWLREAMQEDEMPRDVRRGAAACLGAQADREALDRLNQLAGEGTPPGTIYRDLLAHYVYRAPTTLPLPIKRRLTIFPYLARLRLSESLSYQRQLWMVGVAGAVVSFLGLLAADQPPAIIDSVLTGIVFSALFGGLALIFSVIVAALVVISERWRWWWALPALAVGGGAAGYPLFLIWSARYAGFLVGAAVAIGRRLPLTASPAVHVAFAVLVGVATGGAAMAVASQTAATAVGLFSALFVYAATAPPIGGSLWLERRRLLR